jgi:hypothetical protein
MTENKIKQGELCPECKQFIGTNTMCSDCARFRKSKENNRTNKIKEELEELKLAMSKLTNREQELISKVIEEQATADFIKMIEKKIEERKEDKIRWELTDEDNVKKGHFKNPDFGIQVDAIIFELEELKQMLVGKNEN